jgi:hypothetical protein
MEELTIKPKRKYTKKVGVALGRPKKAPRSPSEPSFKLPPVSPLMLDIMAILTCQAEGDAKVAALVTYRFCKSMDTM